jgi:hypothetical protein
MCRNPGHFIFNAYQNSAVPVFRLYIQEVKERLFCLVTLFSNLLLQTGVSENARRNSCNSVASGQLSDFGARWLIQTAILYVM